MKRKLMITFICVWIASPGWLAVRNISWILLALILAQAPGYAQTTDSSSGQIEVGVTCGPIGPLGDFRRNVGSWSFNNEERQQIRKSIHGAGGWFCGGGGRIPVGPTGRWAIDIGSRYHRGGTASYLADGGIRKNPDGSLTVISTRGQMPFMMFTLGFQFRPSNHK